MKRVGLVLCLITAVAIVAGCAKDNNNVKENETKMTTENVTTKADEKKKVKVEELIVKKGDKEIYGKLYYPEGMDNCPAIIMCHGYNGCNTDFQSDCRYFAQNGYVAYSFDFCGGSTRSKSTGKTTDMTIFTEKEDLLDVLNHIRSLDKVDADNVYIMGGSQGGLVTTLAAEECEDLVKGMVLYFPALNIPDDWRGNYSSVEAIPETVDFWGLTLGKNFFASMREFYTFDYIGDFSKDILIIHGDKDEIVKLSYSEKAQKLYSSVELVVLPGEGHGFSPVGAKTARIKVLEFMDSHK